MKVKSAICALFASAVLSCLAQTASAAPGALEGQAFAMKSDGPKTASIGDQKLAFGYWICDPSWNPGDCYWLPGD
ncbi:hypothetical protein [Paraburkholderia sp. C35]|uniref:hypothetical protein n=1 Tax=Paraburkholderia sp. C35 TaxID=2126993 RepID=UPI000D691F79|nr:hypothetical protein [Paraburkholderia sp. C35]